MTPDELVRLLGDVRDRAAKAAPPVALEMARVYSVHLSRVTLRRSYASPGQFGTPAPPLAPPAYRSGALAGSVFPWAGPSSGTTGRAYAGPHVIYGLAQETGAVHVPSAFEYMHWSNSGGPLWTSFTKSRLHPGGEWWKKKVHIPPRPYMEPAVAETVADGSLQRGGALTFRSLVGWD